MRNEKQTPREENAASDGRLLARPSRPTAPPFDAGLHSLRIENGREFTLYIPNGIEPDAAAPLALMLHGAGGDARHGISLLRDFADECGVLLAAPKSFHATWDVIADCYGADIELIDRALEKIFDCCNVDRTRLAVGGFSDGASYALSLGIINGDLFSHVIAFSPGFMAPTGQTGAPRIYISHGTRDNVLPIDRCSRRIVPQLKRAGYDVVYREFEGAHTIPHQIAAEAVEWFAGEEN